jgi:hypothetical protein
VSQEMTCVGSPLVELRMSYATMPGPVHVKTENTTGLVTRTWAISSPAIDFHDVTTYVTAFASYWTGQELKFSFFLDSGCMEGCVSALRDRYNGTRSSSLQGYRKWTLNQDVDLSFSPHVSYRKLPNGFQQTRCLESTSNILRELDFCFVCVSYLKGPHTRTRLASESHLAQDRIL